MALLEQTIIKQIAVLPEQNAIQVQWANQILRDGELISETYKRKAYGQGQQSEFEADVPSASSYVAAVGW